MAEGLSSENLQDAYPLSGLQAGMLFHSTYSPETDAAIFYDIFSFYLKMDFDISTLRTAARQLATRHPVLRTSFDLSDYSQLLQLVHHKVDIPIQVDDLRHLTPDEQEATLDAWMQAEKNRSIDWSQPPLLRFQIHRRTNETFQFTVSFHHAILDGWSVASMLAELFQIYLSLLGKDVPPLKPAPTVTFRDFIALEQKAVASQEQRQFWSEKLKDCSVLTIPRWSTRHKADASRQILPHKVPLSAELSQELHRLAQSAGVPLKSVLLAAHLRVLNRLSGQSDVLTGVVSHGRPEQADGERVLGLFLNTLPFRLELSGGTWLDLVRDTYRTEQEMLPFRLFPLPELQNMHGGQPLFETGFNFIHFHVYQGLGELAEVQLLGGDFYEATNFTLGAVFRRDPNSSQVNLILEYDSSALYQEQIKAIGGYYAKALAAIAFTPLEPYMTHSLLSNDEQQQMLVAWNAIQTNYLENRCIHQVFEEWTARVPEAIGVIFQDQHLTYAELNRRANQLAHYLQAQGLGPGDLVGIYMKRSLETMVAILGVLKAGGAYVPLDVTYPQERLAYMRADTQPLMLLTKKGIAGGVPTNQTRVIALDNEWEYITQESVENLNSGVTANNLAYVIYTSGSTGQPKGVLVPHRGLPNVAEAMRRAFDITSDDRVLQFSSLSFDASVYDILLALGNGATLCLAQESLLPDQDLSQWLQDVGVTIIPLTVSALAALPDERLRALRVVISGAEACPAELVARWSKGRRFFNVYGPTEATIWATVRECVDSRQKPSIGRPISNAQIYILDQYLQPTPIGVPGELCIGGVGVTRGYLNSPSLTAEKFIPDPFSQKLGARLYRTGDLARYLPDGQVDFLGRIDHQVKIRGFRIELGEIEATLRENPAVQETVVVAREIIPGDKRLIAYIVSQKETPLTTSELGCYLEEKLPDYMIPSTFVMLEALPMTPNGKVDRRALPIPDTARPKLDKMFVAPRTSIEKRLAEIWADVLKLERVGVEDHFIELGGHSLLALQLVSKLNDAFKIELPLRDFFQAGTIANLASKVIQRQADQTLGQLLSEFDGRTRDQTQSLRRLEQSDSATNFSSLLAALPIEECESLLQGLQAYQSSGSRSNALLPKLVPNPVDRYDPFPMTMIQQVYWIGRSGFYNLDCGANIYMEFELTGMPVILQPFFIKRLEGALNQLIERHDMLRMVVLPNGWQKILPKVPPYKVKVTDSRKRDVQSVEVELEKIRARMRTHKALINHWPLFEVLIHRLNDKRIRLHFRIDALLMDGASRGRFVSELFQLVQSPGLSYPSLECTYRDYAITWAEFQNDKENELYIRSRDYWLNRLPTLPPAPDLPLAQDPSHATPCRYSSWKTKLLTPEAWRRLKSRASRAGLTPSGVGAAAYIETLALWSNNSRFTIGLISTYRPILHPQMANIIGNFNTISLLVVDDRPGTFEDRAKHIQQQIITDLQHREFSGHQVLRELHRIRGQSTRMTIPFFFNSVIEYNHPSYQFGVDSGKDKTNSLDPRDTLWNRLRNLPERLGRQVSATITSLCQKNTNALPQIHPIEINLYAPQILLLPTLSEDNNGALWCQWLAVDGVFPPTLVDNIVDDYVQLLQQLVDDETTWQTTPPFSLASAQHISQQKNLSTPALTFPVAKSKKVFVRPRNDLEFDLVGIWETVLQRNSIGVTDDFFDLGGDSFSVVLLVTQIQQQFDCIFPLETFFQEPTVEHLASIVRQGQFNSEDILSDVSSWHTSKPHVGFEEQ